MTFNALFDITKEISQIIGDGKRTMTFLNLAKVFDSVYIICGVSLGRFKSYFDLRVQVVSVCNTHIIRIQLATCKCWGFCAPVRE